ncbi:MAG: PH domain-containing protein [Frankiaceae bacterium]
MSEGPPRLPTVWRPHRARAVVLPAAGLVLAGACLLAAALPAAWSITDRVGIALIGVAVDAVLLLLARPSLSADDEGLTVVNLVNRRRLAWSEVVRVGLSRHDSWAVLDLADGTSLPVMALQSSDGPRTRLAVVELAALIAARGEVPEGGSRT